MLRNMKGNFHYDLLSSKYMANIPLSNLKKNLSEIKDENLKDFYKNIISKANNNEKAYFQDGMFDSIINTKNPVNTLIFYQQDFTKVIEFIDKLLKNLNDNYRIVPYSIKCVCRIIYNLVKNKFPKANKIEKKLLISKFFFQIILIPILLKPDINALINNYIISKNTVNNLYKISEILLKFVSFELYQDEHKADGEKFTPFNIFFLEEMPQLLDFYKKIKNVKLPNFIEKCAFFCPFGIRSLKYVLSFGFIYL